MYTFRNVCLQDTQIRLEDGTTKIFLCSDGIMDDVSPDVKAFLDFMKGLPVNDNFVDEIRNLITDIKHQEKERVSYMTYEMKMQEARNDGKEEGLIESSTQTALDMLRDNEPIEKIIKYSRLPLERIQKLAKEIK